jgi:hypothetical protein
LEKVAGVFINTYSVLCGDENSTVHFTDFGLATFGEHLHAPVALLRLLRSFSFFRFLPEVWRIEPHGKTIGIG